DLSAKPSATAPPTTTTPATIQRTGLESTLDSSFGSASLRVLCAGWSGDTGETGETGATTGGETTAGGGATPGEARAASAAAGGALAPICDSSSRTVASIWAASAGFDSRYSR